MLYSFIAVGIGAASGAWLRWGLGTWLNPIFPTIPLGTLASNLIGGYIMGLAMGFFSHYQALAPETRLLITTGFLGGLTTFSTFSAESITLLARNQYGWTFGIIALHVIGSLTMTALGIFTVNLIKP
jgi:CrcB protein